VSGSALDRQGANTVNDVYFACRSCRAYVDAGYRHAYWALEESGVVRRVEPVRVDAVLGASEYWDAEGASWLAELLPAVRRFFETHANHEIRFGDAEELDIPCSDDPALLEWVMEAGFVLNELPRYYAERLGVRTWDEVVARVEAAKHPPRWWADEELRRAARITFEKLIARSVPPRSDDAV
jgi:hypothetical protein